MSIIKEKNIKMEWYVTGVKDLVIEFKIIVIKFFVSYFSSFWKK